MRSMPVSAPAAAVQIRQPASALFASDIHLDDSRPELTDRFLGLLDATLAAAFARNSLPSLFLLGDLFEYWIGDDHGSVAAQALSERLLAFSKAGGQAFLMHGNRDFLMDAALPSNKDAQTFSARCGAILLPDPTVIEVAGQRIALSHGDALCTDDTRYQQWRALCRSSEWQQQFLCRPAAERLALALSLRKQSTQAQAVTETLSDVNQDAVDALMSRLDTRLLIHGHTHRPMLHAWSPSGCEDMRKRWVLSDWAVSPPRGTLAPITEAATPPAC